MATFSLGTSGVAPGAPGVYINEQAGKAANAALADFSTVYMLVETEEDVPVTKFPFNVPIPITSLNDYKELTRVGTSTVPDNRIPLLSYNCVNEFFQNAQVGDLRVVRVGTPNQIVELEFFPSATKINSTDLPSALFAGNKVFVQMIINGIKLVSGDGSTGYTADGEWLGVPVVIPVDYVANDEANNRKISAAIAAAVAEAIESNPAVNSSVYVRDTGMVNDLNPSSNSQNSFVTIAATTFDGNVSVVTEVLPVGSNFVFMQNAYDIENIVGGQVQLERVPQDYTQCIATAFDGQQDQGYLVTPTAYAQFDVAGRSLVGAAAAAHCENNNYKWMALADPGPFLVTDINKYQDFVPHKAAACLLEGLKYLVDNAIYEWVGNDQCPDRLSNQTFLPGVSDEYAVNESANLVSDGQQVGLLDAGQYTVQAVPTGNKGVFELDSDQFWPVTLPIQKVAFSAVASGSDFSLVSVANGSGGTVQTNVNLGGTEVYVIAAPFDVAVSSEYSLNYVLLALSAADASNIYNQVVLLGGSSAASTLVNPLAGSIFVPTPSGDTALISYADPYWDLPVSINGQTSDLIENTSGQSVGVNTQHLPGTLQDATQQYLLNWYSRTILDPAAAGVITAAPLGGSVPQNSALFESVAHNLRSGQVIYFTQPITVDASGVTSSLVSATTKLVSRPYWVKVVDVDHFALANSLGNFTTGAFVAFPTAATINTFPTIYYSRVLGRGLTQISPNELQVLPMIRGRKYEFDTNSIWNQSLASTATATGVATTDPFTSIWLNNSALTLGKSLITPYGEDISSATQCGWLPKFNTVTPDPTPAAAVLNAFCSPTVDQFFQPGSYFVPSIDPLFLGTYNATTPGTIGPAFTLGVNAPGATIPPGVYNNVVVSGGAPASGLTATVTVSAGGVVTGATVNNAGQGYSAASTGLTLPGFFNGATLDVLTVQSAGTGSVTAVGTGSYATSLVASDVSVVGSSGQQLVAQRQYLVGGYYDVVNNGFAPDGTTPVVNGDRIAMVYNGTTYTWTVVAADALGGDLTTVGQVCFGAQVEVSFSPEQAVPASLWRFDAITSTEIIDRALRGVGFNGVPQAVFIEAGVDNVNRLFDDSQRYFNPFGFIAYYGPWIENGAGQYIPPSPYVTGVAVRRYRAEGYQFPPAGVKYQLADAVAAQISINSSQQNLLNPKGCNAVRTLPGYPQSAVFIWGGRTRVNPDDAQQRLYQFVNTRVILNVVYGSLRSAFDTQIFNVIDGFGIVYNQIISVGNSILNQLYIRGALFGATPSDAFQVICDSRINPPESLENGIVQAKVFVTPVPTLERIQIDLIRVAIGKMQEELDIQGLGNGSI
jgi:hypothetical protein